MPRLWLGLPRRRARRAAAVQVHEGYGGRRVDALAELELLTILLPAERRASGLLADRAGLDTIGAVTGSRRSGTGISRSARAGSG